MKKLFVSYATVFLFSLFLSSCTDSIFHRSYVEAYLSDIDGFLLEPTNEKDGDTPVFSITALAKEEISGASYASKEEQVKFEKIAAKNGDLSYNREFEENSEQELLRNLQMFLAHPIVRINFSSNKAWDEAHPAGASLNDVLMCYTSSPDEYIRKGYQADTQQLWEKLRQIKSATTRKFCQDIVTSSNYTATPIVGKFSEIDFTQYRLIGRNGVICWISWLLPPPQDANLTMEVEFEDGKKVTSTFDLSKK